MPSDRMHYESYIVAAYALAALLIGGLIAQSWLAARVAQRALTRQDQQA